MDKVVLISGANRGLGLSIAIHLNALGYKLSLGMRNPDNFTLKFFSDPETVLTHYYDATQPQSANIWVDETLSRFGKINGLINNAGVLRQFHIDDENESDLDEMWEVNVKGMLRLTRAALPHLKQSGQGRIVNMVSMSGKRVKGKNCGYAVSKYAQMALSHAMRNVGWEHGIRVTAICPSWVNTDMAQEHSSMAPQEMTQPEDVAELVATVLKLPNTAAVPEIAINCNFEVWGSSE